MKTDEQVLTEWVANEIKIDLGCTPICDLNRNQIEGLVAFLLSETGGVHKEDSRYLIDGTGTPQMEGIFINVTKADTIIVLTRRNKNFLKAFLNAPLVARCDSLDELLLQLQQALDRKELAGKWEGLL